MSEVLQDSIEIVGGDDELLGEFVSASPATLKYGVPVQRTFQVTNMGAKSWSIPTLTVEVTGPNAAKVTASLVTTALQLGPGEQKTALVNVEANARMFKADSATLRVVGEATAA